MELTKSMLDNMAVSRIIFREGWVENDKVDIIVVLAFTNSSEEVANVKVSVTSYNDVIGVVHPKKMFKASKDFSQEAKDKVKELVRPISKKYQEVYYGPSKII